MNCRTCEPIYTHQRKVREAPEAPKALPREPEVCHLGQTCGPWPLGTLTSRSQASLSERDLGMLTAHWTTVGGWMSGVRVKGVNGVILFFPRFQEID